MIYVDSSVVLAELLSEDRRPEPNFWSRSLISSRLVHYEIWVRLHARGLGASHGEAASALLGRIAIVELSVPALRRSLEPLPAVVRTLDALHLASAVFVRELGVDVEFATYDIRQAEAARALGLPCASVESS